MYENLGDLGALAVQNNGKFIFNESLARLCPFGRQNVKGRVR